MLINKDMKMADVIHLNHHLLHVLNRFNIHLGFGEKTVETICYEHDIHLDFFLDIVNTFHDASYFPLQHLQKFKAGMLINYLQKTHAYYLNVKLPEIASYIERLNNDKSILDAHKKLLADFFADYQHELIVHINKEEQRVYPYIKKLEKVLQNDMASREEMEELRNYSIHEYEAEHDDVEAKLFDLKNIIIKYLPPPKDSRLLNVILHELFELELDLNNHGHIEDLILVPIVDRMESTLRTRLTISGQ